MKSSFRLFFLAAFMMMAITSISLAQEKPAAKKKDQAAPAEKKEAAPAEKKKLTPEETYAKIRTTLRDRTKLDQAGDMLKEALTSFPNHTPLKNLRLTLVSALMNTGKVDKALPRANELYSEYMEGIDDSRNQTNLQTLLSLTSQLGSRFGKTEEYGKMLDGAVEKLRGQTKQIAGIESLVTVVILQSRHKFRQGDKEGAKALLEEQLKEVASREYEDKNQDKSAAMQANIMKIMVTMPDADEKLKMELDRFVSDAIAEFPDSTKVIREYGSSQVMMISSSYRSDPEDAQKRIEVVSKTLNESSQRIAKFYLGQLKSYERRIESAMKQTKLVGTPAPKFQIDAWVNQGDVTEDSLKGKVVLIDFWSVWCGPCIRTFPHLREWHEEFHSEGLEIVGVTKYYNYEWDDDSNRASRSDGKVSAADEQAMLGKFLAHHELEHPTIVTPKSSTMDEEFAVSGIPHVVLVDRKGNIQMVKVGSSSQNAIDLEAKIKELLEE